MTKGMRPFRGSESSISISSDIRLVISIIKELINTNAPVDHFSIQNAVLVVSPPLSAALMYSPTKAVRSCGLSFLASKPGPGDGTPCG